MTSRGLLKADRLLAGAHAVGPVLGLDTGGTTAGVALVALGGVLGCVSRPAASHCQTLPALVQELLDQAGFELRQLSGVAVAAGPGSFTGLRIGLSYAKGVALATDCQIVGVPRLDAMAVSALECPAIGSGDLLCPILDARRGELYGALYATVAAAIEKLSVEFVLNPEELAARFTGNAFFFGDGVAAYGGRLTAAMGPRANFLDDRTLLSPAVAVAALGAARIAARDVDTALDLQPIYVRPAEAALTAVALAPPTTPGMEELWSGEKKSSFSNTLLTMKS